MPLLFLSIFFQYDLLHCGETANGKNEFMDYSITDFWWNSTPGIDQTDRITPQYSFLPTPMEWLILTRNTRLEPTITTDLKTFLPTRPSYPFDVENYTLIPPPRPSPPPLPKPWHKQYPDLTPPPNFPSDYKYPTIYPSLESGYIPSPSGPTPKGPSFTLPKFEPSEWTFLTEYPPEYISDRVPSSITPRFEYTPTTRDPLPPYAKKWQQEISSYAAADSRTPTNMVPKLSQIFNYDYPTEGVPDAIRRVPKITQDSGSRQLNSSVFEDKTRSIPREAITVIEKKEAKDSKFEREASSCDPDIKKTTPRKNESRVLRVLEMVSTKPKGKWQLDQTMTTTPNTVKEFLIRNTDSYFEMIETLHEGYMMVFLIELTRLVATKERKAVRDVVKHTDQIIYGFYRSGQLLWSGLLIDVTTKVARLLKESKIDVIQNHAANLHHMLSQRHQELSVEVNTILEYADTLYDDDEGRLLFDALTQFAAYPNISLTGYWLCNSLIHNFLRPYRRLKDTQQRQELIDSVNLELKTRLTWSGFKDPPLRNSDVKQADGSPDETKLSTQKEPEAQKEPHSDSTWSPRERKRKRHNRSSKRKRERKRYTYTDLT